MTVDIRFASEEDADLVAQFIKDKPEFGKSIALPKGLKSSEVIERIKSEGSHDQVKFLMVERESNLQAIGYLVLYPRSKESEIGLCVVPGCRLLGNATDFVSSALALIKKDFPEIIKVTACSGEVNVGSIKALLRNGFRLEGRQKAIYRRGDILCDYLHFSFQFSDLYDSKPVPYDFDKFERTKEEVDRLNIQANEAHRNEIEMLKRLKAYDRIISASTIIDLGSGTGEYLPVLRDLNSKANIIAVDRSAQMLAMAKQRAIHDVTFVNDDLLLALKSMQNLSSDVILLRYVTPYLSKSYQVETFKEARRVLRAGGVLISISADTDFFQFWPSDPILEFLIDHRKWQQVYSGGSSHAFREGGKFLAEAGFKQILAATELFTTANISKKSLARILGGQFNYGVMSQWQETAHECRNFLENWATHEGSFGQAMIGAIVAEKEHKNE